MSPVPTCRGRREPIRSASAVELLDRPPRDQAEALAAGEADPGEVLDAALRRIEERNPAGNAIVDTSPGASRRMLADAPRGPLYGVPVALKDEWPLPWRAERLRAPRPAGAPPRAPRGRAPPA